MKLSKIVPIALVFACLMVMPYMAFAASEPEAAEEEHGGDKPKNSFSLDFVKLDPLILPIVDKNGVSQTVSLVVAIEVGNQYQAERVRSLAPRLKDAYIQEMYGMLNRHAAVKGGVLQVKMIKEKLNQVSVKVLGEDTVHDVLLQVVQQRQL